MAQDDIDDFTKSRPPLFWWFLANILAIAFAITSWVVCLDLFRDPTNPTSYQLMVKVGRLDPLEKFEPTSAPRPRRTSGPLALEAEFERFKNEDRDTLNHELLRSYVTNYKKSKFLTYIKGEFKVISSRALTDDDLLPSGVVVRAQAQERPSSVADPLDYPVFIECIFPTKDDATAIFKSGDVLVLGKEKVRDCAAILHVGTLDYEGDSVLYLTVVPLCGYNHPLPDGKKITISPPETANVGAPFPLIR
ncbi:hypothetical protein N9A89_02695 [Akkermansiaceae bacterium]|nr:hypothetical protein [Akkermansiaceae bacterium]MDB4407110.1 hypothetical protein [bacterium]MDA7518663.1 hypothetical protein [Akkermansiaceae bacterium]MDA7535596.1 hypothetical protein [Akkermansiaceae bacterium]MDA7537937.1 hypothetical protein [Akkermansiaceae bacterium]